MGLSKAYLGLPVSQDKKLKGRVALTSLENYMCPSVHEVS